MTDISIGAFHYSIVHERIVLNTIIYERIAEVGIDIELRREGTEGQSQRVRLLCFQIRITITDAGRVASVSERIQIPDTRTTDSHVIGGSQCLGLSQLVREHHRRNNVIKAGIEILLGHLVILHIHESMFVAYTHLGSHFLPLQLVVAISSQDVLGLLEVVRQILVHLIFAIIFLEILAFTLVVSHDVFGTEIDVVHVRNRIGIVQLEGMFIRTGIIIIMLVAEVVRIVPDVLVFRICFAIVR